MLSSAQAYSDLLQQLGDTNDWQSPSIATESKYLIAFFMAFIILEWNNKYIQELKSISILLQMMVQWQEKTTHLILHCSSA